MKLKDYVKRDLKDPNLIFASNKEQISIAKAIIQEYARSLAFSLDFQNFDEEIENLAIHYARPMGFILLAMDKDRCVGVTCLRNLGNFIAEIKRMYVRPHHRGKGYGRKMLDKAITEAKSIGYRYLRLDTVPDMESANKLYDSRGFYEIEDYTYNPIPGARFLEFKL